jgi:hypothetical protein
MDGTSGYRVMAALLAHLGALAAGACAAPSPQVPVTWAPSPQVPVPQVPACAAVCCRTRLVHAGAQAVLSEAGLQCRMIGPFFAWNRLGKAARAGHVGQLPQVQCAHGRAFAAGAWAACTEPWRPPVHPAGSRGAVNRVRGGAWAAPETQASLISRGCTRAPSTVSARGVPGQELADAPHEPRGDVLSGLPAGTPGPPPAVPRDCMPRLAPLEGLACGAAARTHAAFSELSAADTAALRSR